MQRGEAGLARHALVIDWGLVGLWRLFFGEGARKKGGCRGVAPRSPRRRGRAGGAGGGGVGGGGLRQAAARRGIPPPPPGQLRDRWGGPRRGRGDCDPAPC